MQQEPIHIDPETDTPLRNPETNSQEHDDIDVDLATPSSRLNGRPGKRSPVPSSKGKSLSKWRKGKLRLSEPNTGECHLLSLPDDVLVALLGKMPPKGLKALGETCQLLRYAVDDETIWKNCFVNRFFSYGSDVNKSDLTVLAQPSLTEGRGWKKECLAREAMLERWVNSKAMPVSHHPMGLIDALSLSYPTPIPPKPKTLIVGKTHSTPTKPSASSSAVPALIEPSPILPSPKMTHRQKYEALLAATTRPAPYVISAGISAGGMVRSDPLSGKVSKGFWGPGRDANFHLRARPDPNSPPTAIFLPTREQTFALWGLSTGSVVHTTILTKHPSTPGNRASSLNVQCEPSVSHDSAVLDIWAPANFSDTASDANFVTAGADGVIKYWHFTPPAPRSGKRSPASAHTETQGSLKCIFTSNPAVEPFANRSDAVKRRQTSSPDAIVFARCSNLYNVVCGVTVDGDLRAWSGIQRTPTDNIAHLRLDVGSEDEYGGVVKLELDIRTSANGSGTVAGVLIQHRNASHFTRYDLAIKSDGIELVRTLRFTSPLGLGFTKIEAFLDPSAPITSTSHSISAARSPSVEGITEQEPPLPSPTLSRVKDERFGRFVVTGDVDGWISIFPWDPTNADIISSPDETQSVRPIRVWQNGVTKITALDYHCGLVGVGSCNADIKVYDPYPDPPVLLRSYRASHLSAADAALAASDDQDAVYFTVNRIILENDLIVASVGRKVFGWRAGSGKKGGVKGDKKRVTSKGDFKGNVRALDMRSLNEDAAVEQQVMKQYPNSATRTRAQNHSERGQLAAMEDLGLEDGDDALQYALMLSMEDTHSRDLWQGEGEEDDLDSTLQSGSSAGSYQEDPFLAYESHRGGRSRRDNDSWGEEAEVLRDVPGPVSTSSSYRDALGSSLSSQRSTPSVPAPSNALLDAEDIDEETAAAIRAMEDAQRREEAELQQALEMIRLAEERA